VTIEVKDVISTYSNKLNMEGMLMLTQDMLPSKQLKEIVSQYASIENKSGFIKIKPKKGKEIKSIIADRDKAVEAMQHLTCINCEQLEYHAT
jgi:hypothetical protein